MSEPPYACGNVEGIRRAGNPTAVRYINPKLRKPSGGNTS